ncbi:MAG: TlpA disulfide reductase family protein, partial [Ginsengibacter sp.]
MMKQLIILLLLIPGFAFTQSKKKAADQENKGFVITGNVTGFADGTTVSFLNEQTNQPEKQAVIEGGKFIVKGELAEPGFKGLIFGDQPPLIPLFLDNSKISITGDKNAIDKLVITGSPSHALYSEYSNLMKPYDQVIAAGGSLDQEAKSQVEMVSDDFVRKNQTAYVAALAIVRMYQMTQNGAKAEELFKLLPAPVQSGGLGQYANQQIQESKINPIGSVIQDFSQNDTTGKPVKISSFRGKYVLLDFWASWCR